MSRVRFKHGLPETMYNNLKENIKMAFVKPKIYTTATGTVEPYAYLAKPDFGAEGFKTDRGSYKVNLTLPNSDKRCSSMVTEITKAHEANYEMLLQKHEENPPVVQRGKKPLEPYEGDMPFIDNGDGTTTFRFACYDSYVDKKTNTKKMITPAIVDSKGKPIKGDRPNIAAGSEIKVKYTMFPYGWSNVAGASVKLRLSSIMLINLVEFGAGGDDWSDDAEDGGYERDDETWGNASEEEYEDQSNRAQQDEDDSDGDF